MCFYLMSSNACLKMKKTQKSPTTIGLIRESMKLNPILVGGGVNLPPLPLNRPYSVEKVRIFKNERSEKALPTPHNPLTLELQTCPQNIVRLESTLQVPDRRWQGGGFSYTRALKRKCEREGKKSRESKKISLGLIGNRR